jgi:hypothetical protein
MTSPESRSTLAQQRASAQEELEVVITQLLIELAFLLPRGTNVHRHSVGRGLVRFKKAVEDCVKADALLASGTPEPPMRDGIGRMNRASYERMIAENIEWLEQQPRTLERDHVIAIVKASADHEYGAGTPEPAPATCATCQYAGTASEGTRECYHPEWPALGHEVMTVPDPFGCTLHVPVSAPPDQEQP